MESQPNVNNDGGGITFLGFCKLALFESIVKLKPKKDSDKEHSLPYYNVNHRQHDCQDESACSYIAS
jgi:hypothetical protein